MCWELKNAYVDCLPYCSRLETSEENPTTGMICPQFARTGQHCSNPTQANVAPIVGSCPDHNFQNASHLHPDQQRSTQLLAHQQRNEPTLDGRGVHGQASTQQVADPSDQHRRMPSHDYDSSRWPWDDLQNQALNSIYQDNNGVPPLGTYERSSLSPPMPTFGTGSSSTNQESFMPETNAGQGSYQEQDTSSNHQGESREDSRESEKQRDLTSNWRRGH
ncbi:hypothetical protein EAF04_004145 [Stromatinia cepivora]|nr:hypothetical protein EAF04_004145 [Stromatinia cepivora]